MMMNLIDPQSLPVQGWTGVVPHHGIPPITWQEAINTSSLVAGVAWQNAGEENEAQFHAPPEIFVALEGHAETLIGDEWIPVHPGDVVFAASNTVHCTRAAPDSPFYCLYVFPTGPFEHIHYNFVHSKSDEPSGASSETPKIFRRRPESQKCEDEDMPSCSSPQASRSIFDSSLPNTNTEFTEKDWTVGWRCLPAGSETLITSHELMYICEGNATATFKENDEDTTPITLSPGWIAQSQSSGEDLLVKVSPDGPLQYFYCTPIRRPKLLISGSF